MIQSKILIYSTHKNMLHCKVITLYDKSFFEEYSLEEYQFTDKLKDRIVEYTILNDIKLNYGDIIFVPDMFCDDIDNNQGVLVYDGKDLIDDNYKDIHSFSEFKVLVNGIPTDYWRDSDDKIGFNQNVTFFEHQKYRKQIIENLIINLDGYTKSEFEVPDIGKISLFIRIKYNKRLIFTEEVYELLAKNYYIFHFDKVRKDNDCEVVMYNKETGKQKIVIVKRNMIRDEETKIYIAKYLDLLLKTDYLEFSCYDKKYEKKMEDTEQKRTLFLDIYPA